jgi:hypothetical protein
MFVSSVLVSASKSRSLRLVPMVLTVATEATDGVGDVAPLRVASEEPYRVDGALEPALTPGRVFGARVLGAIPMRLDSRSERVVRWNATMGNCLWVSFNCWVSCGGEREAAGDASRAL